MDSRAELMLIGTANSRVCRFLKRSTTIDSVLNTKLHTTPKAYASPSKMTSPRLTKIVNICKPGDQIQHSIMSAKFTMRSFKNQSGNTPSSATRLNTPLESDD